MFSLRKLLKKEPPPPPRKGVHYDPSDLPALKTCVEKILEDQGYNIQSPEGTKTITLTLGTIMMNAAEGMHSEGISHADVTEITNFAAVRTFPQPGQPR